MVYLMKTEWVEYTDPQEVFVPYRGYGLFNSVSGKAYVPGDKDAFCGECAENKAKPCKIRLIPDNAVNLSDYKQFTTKSNICQYFMFY